MENYLTIPEIAKKFNRSESGVRSAIYRNKVSYKKIGWTVIIDEVEFAKYINEKGKECVLQKEIEEWYKSFQDGLSIRDISKNFHRSPEIISNYLKKVYNVNTMDYHRKRTPKERELFLKMRNLYLEDGQISILEVIKRHNYTNIGAFTDYLKRTGINIKSNTDLRSFVVCPDFFSNIDCEVKAYLLGFFAADGHIESEGALKVSVQLDDSHILHLYNKYLCNSKIKIRCKDNQAHFACRHYKIREDIHKLGFDNRKTYSWKNLPIIQENMYQHFIRGYFDGDGSIMVNRRRIRDTLAGYNKKFTVACYNKTILEQVMNKVGIKKYKIRESIRENIKIKGKNIEKASSYLLEVFDTVDLKEIHTYLYTNATFFFKRKKDKFDLAILSTEEIDGALQGNL